METETLKNISIDSGNPMLDVSICDLMAIPGNGLGSSPTFKTLSGEKKSQYESSLDGVSALCIPVPASKEAEERLLTSFLSGFRKLLSKENNWTFHQQLELSLGNCVRCQTCVEACPIYVSSGRQEIYRPTFRPEILRRIKRKYLDKGGPVLAALTGENIELNWKTVARLAELAYRCTMCGRCTQTCPMGVDNGLITRELRKLFSQEMGLAPYDLHELGTVKQLKNSISGQSFTDMLEFIEHNIKDKTGKKIKIPVDKVDADFLFIQTAADSTSWLAAPEAFALVFDAAGLNWTLSSEIGFGGTNFGVWYDDFQFTRVAMQQLQAARRLRVNKIVLGECGHAFKGLASVADRLITDELNIPRESWLPMMADIICRGKLNLDPERNNFPVTLHDPCSLVRQMGVVEPQRKILKAICPQFREMEPHGVNNYCCGGGSGFILMHANRFPDWRASIAGRMKLKQVIEAFQNTSPDVKKYICAPCFTCKLQFRDLIEYYDLWRKRGILYGGLIDLIANAMIDVKKPFIKLEWF